VTGRRDELVGEGVDAAAGANMLVDDVDAEHARLQRAGVPVLAPPTDRPWGERTLHVVDPDGNVVELTRAKQPE
jgi:lactoylglutathione lyase